MLGWKIFLLDRNSFLFFLGHLTLLRYDFLTFIALLSFRFLKIKINRPIKRIRTIAKKSNM